MQRHKLIHEQGEKIIIQLQICKVKLYKKAMLAQVGQRLTGCKTMKTGCSAQINNLSQSYTIYSRS